ncbi:MAG: HEAT repeat domain-containing protein [Thermoguttaceae bacterium]|nr:HEAT repeat domain-containing protein [Thermoguttaceae bacterium]
MNSRVGRDSGICPEGGQSTSTAWLSRHTLPACRSFVPRVAETAIALTILLCGTLVLPAPGRAGGQEPVADPAQSPPANATATEGGVSPPGTAEQPASSQGGQSRFVQLKLKSGVQLVAALLNPDEVPRSSFRLLLEEGLEVVIPRSLVEEWAAIRPEKVEYERRWPQSPPTVEGHWAMAEWCREKSLLAERDRHLQQILELDPNHAEARRLLGFVSRDGQWTTREELMRADGFVLYGGRWMLPQAVRLLEQERKIKAAQGEWKQKISRWQSWLDTGRQGLAREQIAQIKDPFAVDALVDALKNEKRDWARLLFVDALARIGTARAEQALAYCALADPAEEVRLTCLDHLKKRHSRAVVDYFIGKLRSSDNVEVNRAAVALGELGDPSAIGPLIEALVTTHKIKISTGNPGQITTSFGTGGTGVSVGGGPVVVTQAVQNRQVLDALVKLTGGTNFGFDQARWRAWYAAERRADTPVNPRRD